MAAAAVAVVAIGGASSDDNSAGSARAAGSSDPSTPAFTGLKSSPRQDLPKAARDALEAAEAPDTAPTFVVDQGDTLAIVVRGSQTYLGVYNKATERSTFVATPPDVLRKNAGTWVGSGGSGLQTTLAVLVPDGVEQVLVKNASGREALVPVRQNIAVVRDADPEVTYEFGGRAYSVSPR